MLLLELAKDYVIKDVELRKVSIFHRSRSDQEAIARARLCGGGRLATTDT
jgi:hypothetical protein